jgi:hypothetical protein
MGSSKNGTAERGDVRIPSTSAGVIDFQWCVIFAKAKSHI